VSYCKKPESQLEPSALRKWAAVIALVVFAAFALVQVAHFHPIGTEHSNCSLCLSTHCLAAVTQVNTAPAIAFLSRSEIPSQPQLIAHLCITADFIRPPPPIA
jgi:hypothetical protein